MKLMQGQSFFRQCSLMVAGLGILTVIAVPTAAEILQFRAAAPVQIEATSGVLLVGKYQCFVSSSIPGNATSDNTVLAVDSISGKKFTARWLVDGEVLEGKGSFLSKSKFTFTCKLKQGSDTALKGVLTGQINASGRLWTGGYQLTGKYQGRKISDYGPAVAQMEE